MRSQVSALRHGCLKGSAKTVTSACPGSSSRTTFHKIRALPLKPWYNFHLFFPNSDIPDYSLHLLETISASQDRLIRPINLHPSVAEEKLDLSQPAGCSWPNKLTGQKPHLCRMCAHIQTNQHNTGTVCLKQQHKAARIYIQCLEVSL